MKIKNKTKRNKIFWGSFVGIFFVLMILFVGVVLAGPDIKISNPGSSIQICTESVTQPPVRCYDSSTANPTLNWSIMGLSTPTQIDLQVFDDLGNRIVDTTLAGTARSYVVSNLNFSSLYSWRVGTWDNYGSWTSWASDSFTTLPQCKPQVQSLSRTSGDYCSLPQESFRWTYSHPTGKNESKYQLQIDNNSNFSSPEVDISKNVNLPSGSVNTEVIRVKETPALNELAYNNTYYWRVKVWSNDGLDSGWVSGSSFSTPKHKYPEIDFSYDPIKSDLSTTFSDDSKLFGGATVSWRFWIFSGGNPSSSSSSKPVVIFNSTGNYNISLTVRDSDNYQCTKSETVKVEKFYQWIEVP